jgi:hypothetical protein
LVSNKKVSRCEEYYPLGYEGCVIYEGVFIISGTGGAIYTAVVA